MENPLETEIQTVLDETKVFEMIKNAPKIIAKKIPTAPFTDFNLNTDDSWNLVSKNQVLEYLNNRLFFDTSQIPYESMKKLIEIRRWVSEEWIKIPLDLVVYAFGFDNWKGRPKNNNKSWGIRHKGKGLSGSMPSLDVSMLYAGTPSELPSVSNMNMYIQLDGKVFFDNGSGDSHRIAAAILRGDNDIETKFLTVYQLDRNYL